jgi:hypothetical protein
MYHDQHILATTAPTAAAMLPSTGADIVVQLAVAVAFGMIIWGILYSLTYKAPVKA